MSDEHTYRSDRSGQRKHSGADAPITFYPSAGERYFHVPTQTDGSTVVEFKGLSLEEFVETAAEAARTFPPGTRLHKNEVGNLSALDADRNYIGYVDLREGEAWLLSATDEVPNG